MARRYFPAALGLCALLAAPAVARPDVTGGAEFRVNTYTTGAQDDPALAVGAGGVALVAWESAAQDGSGDGIFVRRLDRSGGTPAELQVNTYTTGAQDDAVVAALAGGGFVVVWESTGQDGSGEGLFARLVSGMGEPLGDEFAVNQRSTGNQDTPATAGLPDGGFVVAWEDFNEDHDGETVMARRFDAQGEARGGEFRVNEGTLGDQGEPALAAHGAGFVVAWTSAGAPGPDGSGAAVLARRFDADGAPSGQEFQVNVSTSGDQSQPAVAALADGGFVVAWASYGQDGSEEGIFGQRFDAEGTRVGGEFQANTYTTGVQLWPAIAGDRSGGFTVAWESAGPDGSSDAVVGRLYRADGTADGPEMLMNVVSAGAQEDAAVAADPRGGFVAVWESADGSSDGITARRFRPGPRAAP